MKKRITGVGVYSAAKIGGAFYGLVGLLYGAVISLLMLLGALGSGGSSGMLSAVLVFVIFPIVFVIIGFLGAAILALFFNLTSKWLGGLEIQLK